MTNRYNLQIDNCDLDNALNDFDFVALTKELFEACGHQFLPDAKMSVGDIISFVKDHHLFNATKSMLLKIALDIYKHREVHANDVFEYLDEKVVTATLAFVKRHAKQKHYP